MIRIFGVSVAVTIASLVGAFLLGGPSVLAIVAILIVLEVSLSFDNAVVNAKILERMSKFWQTIFLTVGIAIAVFGMRLIFPLVLVGVTAQMGPVEVIELALEGGHGPGSYAEMIEDAHPAIAGFGGMFLMMLFLDWLFEDREHRWLTWIERPLARLGVLDSVSVIVALGALAIAALTLTDDESFGTVLVSGVLGTITYLLVNGLGNLFEGAGGELDEADGAAEPGAAAAHAGSTTGGTTGGTTEGTTGSTKGGAAAAVGATGKAGFFLFLYLEVLDASFSFDGVVGAFAITQDIFVIAVGLGVGAFWIRSLTVYLVRKGTLNDYVYLEHGAHWAIGALAVLLLVTIRYEVPEIITGLIGVGFILAAFANSVMRNRALVAKGEELHKVNA